MALSRDRIVAEALDLLQAEGLDGVTLRRLADRLGVSAPTLYWHVRDKRELLDLMAVEILGRAGHAGSLPRRGQTWDAWLRQRARLMRTGLLAYRDSARVVAGNRPTVEVLPAFEAQLASLVGVGFAPKEAMVGLLSIGQYVTGSVLDEQLAEGRDESAMTPVVDAIRAGAYPTVLAAFQGVEHDQEKRFEAGLATIILGLRAQLEAKNARRGRRSA